MPFFRGFSLAGAAADEVMARAVGLEAAAIDSREPHALQSPLPARSLQGLIRQPLSATARQQSPRGILQRAVVGSRVEAELVAQRHVFPQQHFAPPVVGSQKLL